MKVFIAEDELPALENLKMCLNNIDNNIEVAGTAGSIAQSLNWLDNNAVPDLILMDIHLSDGLSFHVLKEDHVNCPVIFTTAYDRYMTEAFEYNCIDYLLKPVDAGRLSVALNKYKNLRQHFINNHAFIIDYLQNSKKSKSRIIVKKGTEFLSLKPDDIVYFFTEHKLVFAVDKDNRKFLCTTSSLADVEDMLDETKFFRANRKYIVNADHITKFKSIEKSKINVEVVLPLNEEIIVSQENAAAFKKWISGA
ncbi:LytR/AlgR family response regulator transcription factor [Parafilimonas sp.]|uniref:LytR/AlgR family response regulator transcription factor n=1 Tax=Parafilimonas sp. TaxID=1969739 RepID=UPI0039E47FA2